MNIDLLYYIQGKSPKKRLEQKNKYLLLNKVTSTSVS